MPLIPASQLFDLAVAILRDAGSAQAEADTVAQHLVDANLAGHDSHGVTMLPLYLGSLRRGGILPNRAPRLVRDGGATLVFDGDRGFGPPAARVVLAAAMERARDQGVALAALRNSGHLGRLGAYGEQVAQAGFAAMLWVNAVGRAPTVAPFGAAEARLSSNPFCLAYPALAGLHPVVLDAATASLAVGKARVAQARGETLPPGLLLDDRGEPTTDPRFALGEPRGALLPFGLHKGSGLGLFCDLLAGALTGGETAQPGNGNQQRGAAANNLLAVVIDPAKLADTGASAHEARALLDYFRSARPLDPAAPVMLPGELEARTRAARASAGIPVDNTTWSQLTAAAAAAGVPMAAAA
jgi:uncharacterized oxidoreductase